jgi:hypothetical protein
MTVTFAQAMYLCALAALGGGIIALAARHSIQAWREAGDELARSDRSNVVDISHIAPQRFGTMTEKQREKLRELNPKFAEMEDIKIANERDAEKMRRKLAPGLPAVTIFPSLKAYREERQMGQAVEAGMAEVGS